MERIDITGVPETMLQTLYARAQESSKPEHKIYDEKAIEIVQMLDYDFTNAGKDAVMSSGVIARTILLDRMVAQFVAANPHAAVINIACGMDTRFYRVDNGMLAWYNIDLPETIAVRSKFLEEKGRVQMLGISAMDEAWAQQVDTGRESTLVVVEGLSMYLKEADVRQILSIIERHFSNVTVFFEILSPMFVGKDVEKSIKASKASFTWGARSGRELVSLVPGFAFVEDRSLVETMQEMYPIYKVLGKIPFIRNMSNKIAVLEK
ncbi:MAG: class I SAM-dependent methyltransferase [Lachnospiraceae bacterium]|nr:class I SAM-dependent methyltransferase [Lachnospiraceae bacterium]